MTPFFSFSEFYFSSDGELQIANVLADRDRDPSLPPPEIKKNT